MFTNTLKKSSDFQLQKVAPEILEESACLIENGCDQPSQLQEFLSVARGILAHLVKGWMARGVQ